MASIDELTVKKEDLDFNIKQAKIDYDFVSIIQESTGDFTIIMVDIDDDESIPLWLKIAGQELESGVAEISGKQHHPRILEYHNVTKLSADNDETPWCSSFVNFCMKEAGVEGTGSARARDWETWGDKLDEPFMGCIAVFTRPEGGHVGFYVGSEESGDILLLGGNQGDKVSIARRSTAKLLSYRWPKPDQQNQSSTNIGARLGKLSEKFESRGEPSAIGFDSTGGFSYGTYQIASKTGAMSEFLNFLKSTAPPFYNDLKAAGGDTAARAGDPAFKNSWEKLAEDSAFDESQYEFIKQKYYDVQAAFLKTIGLDVNARSAALQNVVWSVAVQHGPNAKLIQKALAGKTPSSLTDDSIINAIYDERSKVDIYFASSTNQVKKAVKNRFVEERKDAIAMLP